METADTETWHSFPAVVVLSPVLALAAGPGGLWAGGAGGVAWYTQGDAWAPRVSGLALSGVAALAWAGAWLLAGGVEGIARSRDGDLTWQQANVPAGAAPVAALVVSPRFTEDGTALAATLNGGIVWSDDAGRTWREATFGLQELEALALAWGSGETVLAATADRIYRSSNAGRAWCLGAGSEGAAIAALAYRSDGTALAALAEGGLLASQDRGAHWSPYGQVPSAVRTTALLVMGGGPRGCHQGWSAGPGAGARRPASVAVLRHRFAILGATEHNMQAHKPRLSARPRVGLMRMPPAISENGAENGARGRSRRRRGHVSR
jgi:hypothetical protein